jgi:basic membrane lipoprotein Med (substrate-binding protein (PBP1-ABC) superfamily)
MWLGIQKMGSSNVIGDTKNGVVKIKFEKNKKWNRMWWGYKNGVVEKKIRKINMKNMFSGCWYKMKRNKIKNMKN